MTKTKMTKEQKKLSRKEFFPFSKGEEIFNAVSHIVGASFALVALVLLIIKTAGLYGAVEMLSVIIYGISMLVLFTMSAIYHFLRKNRAKKVFRIFDQCSIFLLIAGSYTPFCLITFKQDSIGYIMFGVVWLVSILGITLNAINMRHMAVKVFSQIAYIVLGWCVILAISPLIEALATMGVVWLVIGGVLYTAGVAFFAFGRKVPYFHPVWHIFVFLGAVAHFISVYFYVL